MQNSDVAKLRLLMKTSFPQTDNFPGYNEVLRYFMPAVWGPEMVR